MKSYLSSRRQRVKLGSVTSSWQDTFIGVPQGSILGPLLFNIFMNDIFYVIDDCQLYNYADDNTICAYDKDLDALIHTLEIKSEDAIVWFKNSAMVANPDKFQAMLLTPSRSEKIKNTLHIKDSTINGVLSQNPRHRPG